MPTCLVVQHLEPEGPYAVAEALERAEVCVDVRRVFAGDDLPGDTTGFDGLVVMGGPMSATSDQAFPTRAAEIDLLARTLAGGSPILGVCLGAQLLAAAAGAAVYGGAHGPEIGWAPVTLGHTAGDALFGGLNGSLEVLHWHSDTFDLPEGAALLASSARYPNQAFRLGNVAWGLQFHLEVDDTAVAAFVAAFGSEVAALGVDVQEITAQTPGALAGLSPLRRLVTDRFAAALCERAGVGSGDRHDPRADELRRQDHRGGRRAAGQVGQVEQSGARSRFDRA